MSTPADQIGNQFRWDRVSGFQRPVDPFVTAAAQFVEDDGVQFSDYAKSVMGGGASLVQSSGWLAKQLGAENIGSSIEEMGANAVDFWHDGLSDAAKTQLSKEIIRRNDQGEYEWGDPSFNTIGLMGAQSLLGTAAGMGVGAGLTKTLQVFANPFGRKALQVAAAGGSVAAEKKLRLVNSVLGVAGFGAGEGAIGGISAGASVYDSVMQLPSEKLMANDRYRMVYDSTDDRLSDLERHQYAADTVAKEASSSAGWQSGLTTALLGAPMGAYFGRILGGAKLSSSLPRALATSAGGEAAQEFAQSGAETIISNIAKQPFEPDLDTFEGVLNSAVGGALAGGLLGGAFAPAAVSGAKQELKAEDQAKQQKSAERVGGELKAAATAAANAGVSRTELLNIIGEATSGKTEPGAAIIKIRQLENSARTGEPVVDDEADTNPVVSGERPVEDTQKDVKVSETESVDKSDTSEPLQPGGKLDSGSSAEAIVSRSPKEVKAATELISTRPTGVEQDSVAGDIPVKTKFQLVESSDLMASHTLDGKPVSTYPQALQPRDRSLSASQKQLTNRVNDFDPQRITQGNDLGSGAPLISPEGIVESGNGRAMMMEQIYQSKPQAAAQYRDHLNENAESFGLNADQIKSMKQPVLVRTRQDKLSEQQLIDVTQAANMPSSSPVMPVETVQDGEKGVKRLRKDKRVKKFLQSKRPVDDDQRLIDYRTQAVLGANMAMEAGADQDVIDFLKQEHTWAVSELQKVRPEYDWINMKSRPLSEFPAKASVNGVDVEVIGRDLTGIQVRDSIGNESTVQRADIKPENPATANRIDKAAPDVSFSDLVKGKAVYSRKSVDNMTISEEVEIAETGEVAEIETNAGTFMRRMDKRINNIESLMECIRA